MERVLFVEKLTTFISTLADNKIPPHTKKSNEHILVPQPARNEFQMNTGLTIVLKIEALELQNQRSNRNQTLVLYKALYPEQVDPVRKVSAG